LARETTLSRAVAGFLLTVGNSWGWPGWLSGRVLGEGPSLVVPGQDVGSSGDVLT
jgi:hypothetical protein